MERLKAKVEPLLTYVTVDILRRERDGRGAAGAKADQRGKVGEGNRVVIC